MEKRPFKMSILALLCLTLIAGTACKEKKKGGFSVDVVYTNADKLSVTEGPVNKAYLLEVPYGKDQAPIVLDSFKVSGSHGKFTLNGASKGQEVYELVFGNNALAVPLINDAPEVKVTIDLGKRDDFYDVTGSEASVQLKDLINVFGKKNYEVEKCMADLDSVKATGAPDSILIATTNKKNSAIQDLNTYLKQFINTNGNATVCALALSWSSRSFSKPEFETSLNELLTKYPNNAVLQGLKQSYEEQLSKMASQSAKEGNWVGKQAPDLTLPDVNGTPISISSYKGKYLLVDFWASWCGPCRAENPNVVAAYAAYKNKNFAILGVSLDKEKEPWQEAIKADKLEWKQVSDLKYWSSKAVDVYGFGGIPYNVLIDPQGKVIGESLRGEDLMNKLKEVMP